MVAAADGRLSPTQRKVSTKIVLELTEPQSTIFLNKKRFRLVVAGRRFGKSFLAFFEMYKRALSKEATERGGFNIWYVANTADNARRIMWNSFLTKEKYVPQAYVAKKNEQRMVLTFKNGSTISVFSGEEPDSLRGSSIDFLVMDECAFVKEAAWLTIYPALTDKYCKGEVLLISSPDGYNWFYKLYSKHLGETEFDNETGYPSQWAVFKYTTLEGGNVDPAEIEAAKKNMTPNMFKKEYLASFDTMADRIYENFDEDLNNGDEFYDPEWGSADIHIGMDFNVRPMTAAISVIEHDRELGDVITFFDEIVTEGYSNTQQMCDKIKAKYPRATKFVYPDPTGKKHQPSAPVGVTDFSILKDNGFIVCAPHAPYPSKDKWNSANTGFLDASGRRRVRICKSRCPHLVDSLNGFVFKENGEPDKSTGFDHITDAMAYEIAYKMPIISRKLYKARIN